MSLREDLVVVNAALRDLVRLQLAGELDPTSAWQERRQLLESVDAVWEHLPEDADAVAGQPADAASQEEGAVAPVLPVWRRSLAMPRWSWPVMMGMILLLVAVATLIYVGSL